MQIAAADKSLGTDPTRAERWPVPRRQAWFAFAMAFLLMIFDFMDRQIVVAMFPALKAEWGLSDKDLGALVAVVSITIALFSLPIALVADRWSRVESSAVMAAVEVWPPSPAGSAQLRPARCGARGHRAGRSGLRRGRRGVVHQHVPGGAARHRDRRLSGGGRGRLYAGRGAGRRDHGTWGWQAAFGVVGIPGLVLALLSCWCATTARSR